MGIGKQSKILTDKQVQIMLSYLKDGRNGLRNAVIFLLSVKSGLRAKEIAHLKWSMVVDSNGDIGSALHLTNKSSKGKSGRIIPLNKDLKASLEKLYEQEKLNRGFDIRQSFVIRTERSDSTSPQAIVNMFQRWYRDLGFVGCSSHSGRRTFITNASRKIGQFGGSLRDVQILAGHKNLQTTQRYIEYNSQSHRKVVDAI